jgi:phage terminase Nu1 subunit (DNA packaging protein)
MATNQGGAKPGRTRGATVDTSQLAKLFDTTPRTIQRLTNDGVLVRARDEEGKELRGRFEVFANVRAYVKYLREAARLDDASESKYIRLRNQKMAAESRAAELKLGLMERKLHRAEDVEHVITAMITTCRARLLAIPSRTARLLLGKKKVKEIYDVIYGEIVLALKELSGYDANKFSQQTEDYLVGIGAEQQSGNGQSDNGESAPADDE